MLISAMGGLSTWNPIWIEYCRSVAQTRQTDLHEIGRAAERQ